MRNEMDCEAKLESELVKVKDDPEAKVPTSPLIRVGMSQLHARVQFVSSRIANDLLERISSSTSDPCIFYALEPIFEHMVAKGHLDVKNFEGLSLPASPSKALVVRAFNALHCESVSDVIGGVGVRIIKNRIDFNTLDIKWQMLIGETHGRHMQMTQEERDNSPFWEDLVELYCKDPGELGTGAAQLCRGLCQGLSPFASLSVQHGRHGV